MGKRVLLSPPAPLQSIVRHSGCLRALSSNSQRFTRFRGNVDACFSMYPEAPRRSPALPVGNVSGTLYVNGGSGIAPYPATGTFTVAENGRGTLLFDSASPLPVGWASYDFWMSSRKKGAGLKQSRDADG